MSNDFDESLYNKKFRESQGLLDSYGYEEDITPYDSPDNPFTESVKKDIVQQMINEMFKNNFGGKGGGGAAGGSLKQFGPGAYRVASDICAILVGLGLNTAKAAAAAPLMLGGAIAAGGPAAALSSPGYMPGLLTPLLGSEASKRATYDVFGDESIFKDTASLSIEMGEKMGEKIIDFANNTISTYNTYKDHENFMKTLSEEELLDYVKAMHEGALPYPEERKSEKYRNGLRKYIEDNLTFDLVDSQSGIGPGDDGHGDAEKEFRARVMQAAINLREAYDQKYFKNYIQGKNSDFNNVDSKSKAISENKEWNKKRFDPQTEIPMEDALPLKFEEDMTRLKSMEKMSAPGAGQENIDTPFGEGKEVGPFGPDTEWRESKDPSVLGNTNSENVEIRSKKRLDDARKAFEAPNKFSFAYENQRNHINDYVPPQKEIYSQLLDEIEKISPEERKELLKKFRRGLEGDDFDPAF